MSDMADWGALYRGWKRKEAAVHRTREPVIGEWWWLRTWAGLIPCQLLADSTWLHGEHVFDHGDPEVTVVAGPIPEPPKGGGKT